MTLKSSEHQGISWRMALETSEHTTTTKYTIISIFIIYTILSIQFKLNEVKLVVETTIKLKKIAVVFLKLKMAIS